MKKALLEVLVVVVLLVSFPLPVWADRGENAVTVFGQEFTLGPGERLSEDLVVFGGRVYLQRKSLVEGDIVLMGSEARIEGEVRGSVVSFGGVLELTDSAVIHGDLTVLGHLRRHPKARIKGNETIGLGNAPTLKFPRVLGEQLKGVPQDKSGVERAAHRWDMWRWFLRFIRRIGVTILLLFLVALVVSFFPTHVDRVAHVLRHSALLSFGVGLLTLILIAVLVPLLAILCIGLPLAFGLILGVLLAGLLGWAAAGKVVGNQLFQTMGTNGGGPLGEVLVGSLLLALPSWIPYVGSLLSLLIIAWGIGAVVLTRFGTSLELVLLKGGGHELPQTLGEKED